MSEEQVESLRDAMRVYGIWGFDLEEWLELRDNPTFITVNDRATVHIEF